MNPIAICSCGRVYTAPQWLALPYGGRQHLPWGEVLEYRHCTCGSTRAVVVVPEPAEQEAS